ncbi:hypothetical protein EXN66_Car008438 [Channa argus]|uniref:Uncharacterized protein n=1 Tax=Channa argus TaxID=215402 RepID=A0A6G1PR68_CHAAH|nr:hypothetical protein EXN66_Car008438 [Channa argus]
MVHSCMEHEIHGRGLWRRKLPVSKNNNKPLLLPRSRQAVQNISGQMISNMAESKGKDKSTQ